MKNRTRFAYRIDHWTDDGESIVEHLADVEDFQVAMATYHAACKRWPRKAITLRQEGRVIEDTALRAAAVFQRIDDADYPLATRMDMHMSDLDGLLVAAPATPVLVQCLDQLELQAHQSSGVAPVNLDVRILQMNMVRSNITASLFPGAPS